MASRPKLVGPPSIHKHILSSSSSCSIDPFSPPKQNPCVDLFYSQNLVKNLPTLLKQSWDNNPITTLKIVFTLQKIATKNYDSKDAFLEALLWLYHNHPFSLVLNLNVLDSLGCIKDLLDLLCIIVHGRGDQNKDVDDVAMAKKVVHKFASDKSYRILHNNVAIFFVENLDDDLQFLAKGEIENISLASRLCPSLDSFYDKRTLMCEGIARMLFPRELEEYEDIEEAHYAYRIRDRLRRDVLVPLRKALSDQHTFVKSPKALFKKDGKKLFKIYQRNHKRLYTTDDDEKLKFYLDISNNMKFKALKPLSHYEIITSLNSLNYYEDESATRKWWNEKDKYAERGLWKNCLAIYNVSNAKASVQDFSLGMTLLLSELCDAPWKGKICTVSHYAQLKKIEGSDLISKIKYLKGLKYEHYIRFSEVFDEILECAISQKVSEENMIRKIFVFSDIGFEEAANNFIGVWVHLAKYIKEGYKTLPQVIFWDLRNDKVEIPKIRRLKHWVMIKGFSRAWATHLLDTGVVPSLEEVMKMVQSPEAVMQSAISRKELHNLVVFD